VFAGGKIPGGGITSTSSIRDIGKKAGKVEAGVTHDLRG